MAHYYYYVYNNHARKMSDGQEEQAEGTASALSEHSDQNQSQPIQIQKKKQHHWWQNIRRLSFTRTKSVSESSDTSASPVQSPTEPSSVLKMQDRRFSESSTGSTDDHEKNSENPTKLNQSNSSVPPPPPECFVPPWV